MATAEMDYHQANDTSNKDILHKLADESGEIEIAAVIKCYDIGSTGTESEIRKEMGRQKLENLKSCATYLGVQFDGTKKAKFPIITGIMVKLNSLLRDLCGICGEYYNVDLNEKPLFSCIICRQGCHRKCFDPIHTLFNALDANQRKAMQFTCTNCYSEHSIDKDEITVNAKKSPIKAKLPNSDEHLHSEGQEDDPDADKHITNTADDDQRESDDKANTSIPSAPITHSRVINGDSNGDSETTAPTPAATTAVTTAETTTEDASKIEVCPNYKWARCPLYGTCPYRHPSRCRSWLDTGACPYGWKCKFNHPPLCNQSIQSRQCLNVSCKYFHLTKTIRPKKEEQPNNSPNASYYQNISRQVPSAQVPPLMQAPHMQPPRMQPPRMQPPHMPNPLQPHAEYQHQQSNYPPLQPPSDELPEYYQENRGQIPPASQNQPPQRQRPTNSQYQRPSTPQNQAPQSSQHQYLQPTAPQTQPPQYPPQQDQNNQYKQPSTSQENHFLEHIKETNATMKGLQNLISSLLNAQAKSPQMQPIQIQQVEPSQPGQQTFQIVGLGK